MPVRTIHLQPGCKLEIDDPHERLLEILSEQANRPVTDPQAAVRAALNEPCEYPPLRETVFPGDRIVIAVEERVPQAASLVVGVVAELISAGVEAERVAILLPATSSFAATLTATLKTSGCDAIRVVRHDPGDRNQLALLATAASGEPVVLNRLLCDADLVIPLGVVRPPHAPGAFGVHHAIYPTYADDQTQQHFRVTAAFESEVHHKHRRQEVNEAAWLLGVQFTVQVVPAARGQVLAVHAGLAERVDASTRALADQVWEHSVPGPVGLVIAAVGATAEDHCWHDVAEALAAARAAADEGTVIALITNLAERPGPALAHLLHSEEPNDALHRIRREKSPDAWAALQFAAALEQGPVFMFSELEDELLEELRIAPIHTALELSRLANRCGQVVLLHEAQLLSVRS